MGLGGAFLPRVNSSMASNSIPLKVWLQAARPKTLTAGLVPVLVGTALAAREGRAQPLPALAALAGALLIQVGTNLTNDYYDFKKGADTAERLGPQRVTQAGLIPPGRVLAGAVVSFALAVVVGLYLAWVGGWPIVAIGLASVASGYAYTGGPFPLGYNGLGDLFVMIFFGFVAVCGTYYVQAHEVTAVVAWCAVPVGAIGTALIVVNNLRDVSTDVKVGKRTLAVRFGRSFARAEYAVLLAVSFLVPLVLAALELRGPGLLGTLGQGLLGWGGQGVLLSWLALPAAVGPLRTVFTAEGPALNGALHGTAKLQLVFGLLLCGGLLL
jgi:1,4-dihydroxy-2-naphthoate octaprenyltransferase